MMLILMRMCTDHKSRNSDRSDGDRDSEESGEEDKQVAAASAQIQSK